MGVRHALFPMLALGAELAASFPTLFSTASGVSGLVAGPSWTFQPQDYWVRPLSSLRLALAGAGLRTRLRHVCNRRSASWPFTTGSAIAFGDAFAQRNGSDLLTLRLPFAYKLAVLFLTSPTFRKLFTSLARTSFTSRSCCSLCAPFGVFG